MTTRKNGKNGKDNKHDDENDEFLEFNRFGGGKARGTKSVYCLFAVKIATLIVLALAIFYGSAPIATKLLHFG